MKKSNTAPKPALFDVELATRDHAVNKLEKAVNNCRNLMTNIKFKTERFSTTTQYYPM